MILFTLYNKIIDADFYLSKSTKDFSSSERSSNIFPPVLGINAFKVISTRPDIFDKSLGGVIYGVVILLP